MIMHFSRYDIQLCVYHRSYFGNNLLNYNVVYVISCSAWVQVPKWGVFEVENFSITDFLYGFMAVCGGMLFGTSVVGIDIRVITFKIVCTAYPLRSFLKNVS